MIFNSKQNKRIQNDIIKYKQKFNTNYFIY